MTKNVEEPTEKMIRRIEINMGSIEDTLSEFIRKKVLETKSSSEAVGIILLLEKVAGVISSELLNANETYKKLTKEDKMILQSMKDNYDNTGKVLERITTAAMNKIPEDIKNMISNKLRRVGNES